MTEAEIWCLGHSYSLKATKPVWKSPTENGSQVYEFSDGSYAQIGRDPHGNVQTKRVDMYGLSNLFDDLYWVRIRHRGCAVLEPDVRARAAFQLMELRYTLTKDGS